MGKNRVENRMTARISEIGLSPKNLAQIIFLKIKKVTLKKSGRF